MDRQLKQLYCEHSLLTLLRCNLKCWVHQLMRQDTCVLPPAFPPLPYISYMQWIYIFILNAILYMHVTSNSNGGWSCYFSWLWPVYLIKMTRPLQLLSSANINIYYNLLCFLDFVYKPTYLLNHNCSICVKLWYCLMQSDLRTYTTHHLG